MKHNLKELASKALLKQTDFLENINYFIDSELLEEDGFLFKYWKNGEMDFVINDFLENGYDGNQLYEWNFFSMQALRSVEIKLGYFLNIEEFDKFYIDAIEN